MVREIRPYGSGQMESVEPRAESMAGESAKEALFRAFAVGYDDGSLQAVAEVGPEREKRWCLFELFRADAVYFSGGPEDGLVGLKVGDEEVGDTRTVGPGGEADLDGVVGAAFGGSG